MKKQMRKAMLSTMCMLIVGIMCLTGVTYAWFSAGTTAEVSQINVSVADQAGGSIMISADGETFNFTSSVSPDSDALSGDISPASTIGELDSNGVMKFFTGTIVDSTTITSAAATTSGYYKSFNLYLWNPGNDAISLKVAESGSSFASQSTENKSELACRVAFVPYESVTRTSLKRGDYSFTRSGDVTIFEPNASTHHQNGISEQWINAGGNTTPSGKFDYYGVKAAHDEAFQRYANSDYASKVTAYDFGADQAVITVSAQSIAKLTVYVWIEGQDVDCLNEISGFDITGTIKFEKFTPATTE